MRLAISDPELFGVTESSATFSFTVTDGSGPVDAPARISINGEERFFLEGVSGTRLVRIEGLSPDADHRIDIQVKGAAAIDPSPYFPETFRTLPPVGAELVGSFATLNDIHVGEPRFGGMLTSDGELAGESAEYPVVHDTDTEIPYWRFMNEDAIADINQSRVELAITKGDIADMGRREQFEDAAALFSRFQVPHHAFLGNHDHYGRRESEEVDGYALLGQPPAPRSLELGGWCLVLLDTVEPGQHHGIFPDERLRWLEGTLAQTRERRVPTLLLMHHQPVPPQFSQRFPNRIGMRPEHSLRLLDLIGQHPQVRGVLIGHTHRNRVRRYPQSGATPFVEVNCTKDYPGGWAHYRLYNDGSFRQEVRRTSSERALAHSARCRDFFNGGYRDFVLGSLENRCFSTGGSL